MAPTASVSTAFPLTRRFREAAELVNKIASAKYPLLLNRILQKIHLKDGRIFTVEQEEQLQAMFDLTATELTTVIDASSYLLEQAAFAGLRAEPLKATLIEAGFDEVHAQVTGLLWETQSIDVVNKLRDRCLGGPKVLENVDWHMQLVMGESSLREAKDTTALFDFNLARPDVTTDKKEESFTVEFTHQQLYSFFLDLEKIQGQLDSLS